jgi:hypothetical protein
MGLLTAALEVVFTKFNLRLAVDRDELNWQKGLLALPDVIPVRVERRVDRPRVVVASPRVAGTMH